MRETIQCDSWIVMLKLLFYRIEGKINIHDIVEKFGSRALKVLQERCCILKFAKEQELVTVPSRGNQFHRK